MNKCLIMCFVIASSIEVSAAPSKISLQPISVDESSSVAATETAVAGGEIVSVKARGVGANKVDALKDAYRDAVERAVGLYVDAEQQMKNDEVLSDQVLTQSNAYVQKYDLIKEEVVGGLVQVRIVAQVRKTALVKKISGMMPVQNVALGDTLQNLHAKMVSTESRNVDGAALVKNVLKDFDPCKQLMKATLASNKPKVVPIQDNASKVRIMYPFQVEIDKERYLHDFMPKMKQILDQISITPAKKVRVAGVEAGETGYMEKDRRKYMEKGPEEREPPHCGLHTVGVFDGLKVFQATISGADLCWRAYNYIEPPFREGGAPCNPCDFETKCPSDRAGSETTFADGLSVILVTDVKSSGMSVVSYTVDSASAKAINDWQKQFAGAEFSGGDLLPDGPRYEIIFKDKNDEELVVGRWMIHSQAMGAKGHQLLFNSGFVKPCSGPSRNKYYWIVAPYLRASAERYVEWVSFDVQKDDLAKIASVSIELAD